MDRDISHEQKESRRFKKLLPFILLVAGIVGAYFLLRNVLTKTASASETRIAKVERGHIKSTLAAAGLVMPASERVINAPVTTEIQEVMMRPGAEVSKGDKILKLDQEYTALEYDKLQDELSLRKNSISKLKLEFDKNLRDLDYENQIKALQLSELETQLIDQQRLLTVGGATAEEVEAADLKLKIARIEKKKLENELQYQQSVNATEKDNLQLEYDIQAKRLRELSRKLAETVVQSPSDGVVTWINEDIGKTVTIGEPLVKIANLDRYRIEATTSDRNAKQILVGQAVEIRIGKEKLAGEITRILPEIVNNTVKFYVSITDEDHPALRPNLRTELNVIISEKSDVLRAKRGNALKGTKNQYVYKVDGDMAIKTRITKGVVSSDYFEIESGLDEGDRIIISDTEKFEHMDQFQIVKK